MNFIKDAKGLAKNPLGIIALFISFVYAMSTLVTGFTSKTLTTCERLPLIWFIIIFPILTLGTFLYLVTKHHRKLYSPSDYQNEENFFKDYDSKTGVNEYTKELVDDPENAIDRLLIYSSSIGLFALYAVYLAEKNDKRFSLSQLEKITAGFLGENYTHGYLVAASAAGAFSFSSYEQPFEISELNEQIKKNIREIVYYQADYDKKMNNSDFLYSQLDLIERFLGEK